MDDALDGVLECVKWKWKYSFQSSSPSSRASQGDEETYAVRPFAPGDAIDLEHGHPGDEGGEPQQRGDSRGDHHCSARAVGV